MLFKFFQETSKIKPRKLCDLKPFKQIAWENINVDDKQIKKEKVEKTNNPYYFTHKILKVGFKVN